MKKICVIDGTLGKDLDYQRVLETYGSEFDISYFKLSDLNIHSCIGCWDCWLKTPGICLIKDDQEAILKSYVNADDIVFISNVKTGFITSTLKLTLDRLIPTVLPYIRTYKGEMHHYQRYDHSPNLHVLLNSDGVSDEVSDLIKDYFERVVLNMVSTLESFTQSADEGGIVDVLSHC